MKYEYLENVLQEKLGTIQSISPIEKGFSNEKKYKIEAEADDYLLRVAPLEAYLHKLEEFDVMKLVYGKGVKCNKPIDVFQNEEHERVYSIFSFLPGYDAEDNITGIPESTQFEMGFSAGCDLKIINSIKNGSNNWKQRKWKKHEYYLRKYYDQDYKFKNDEKVIKFIERNYDQINQYADSLQHDDFHLGNIIIDDEKYVGILDFNRYDWGDPLHEFTKLEWFTWPIS